MGMDGSQTRTDMSGALDLGVDESSDEVQRYVPLCVLIYSLLMFFFFRYMHGRKGDELAASPNANENSMEPSIPAPSTSGSRTRRTGLLTVMERPPGMFFSRLFFFWVAIAKLIRFYIVSFSQIILSHESRSMN